MRSARSVSPRLVRVVATFTAILALSLGGAHFLDILVYSVQGNDQCLWVAAGTKTRFLIKEIVPGGVADRAGLRDGDTLTAINGHALKHSAHAMVLITQTPTGQKARYTIHRSDGIHVIDVEIIRLFDVVYFSQFMLGLGFLFMGYLVVMAKPQGRVQRWFGWYSVATMVMFGASAGLNGMYLYYADHTSLWYVTYAARNLANLLVLIVEPALYIGFFMLFPVRRGQSHSKWIIGGLLALGVVMAGLQGFGMQWMVPKWVYTTIGWTRIGLFLAGYGLLTDSYYRFVEPEQRKALRPILIAFVISVFTTIYMAVVVNSSTYQFLIDPRLLLPALLLTVLPLAFGYSIFRYRLMDTHVIIKRSLIYAVLTAMVAALYLLIVVGIGQMLQAALSAQVNNLMTFIALVVIALLLNPVKQRAQEWVDRVFFRDRSNYQRALLEFSKELPRKLNLQQIMQSLSTRIATTMHVEKTAVTLFRDDAGRDAASYCATESFCPLVTDAPGLLATLARDRRTLYVPALLDDNEASMLTEAEKEKLRSSKVALIVPILLQERTLGIICVGKKKSGRAFSQEDVDMLDTVAGQAAIAIENAILHASELEKQKIERELAVARRIQQSLLPKSDLSISSLDVAGVSLPATTVGGDYFDYILLDAHRVLVAIGDVSGKGVPAALYMSKVQGMIQLASRMYDSPREILTHVNTTLYSGIERNAFVTIILALFDLDTRTVRICRAGHPHPLSATNGHADYLRMPGIGLGLDPGDVFNKELVEKEYPLPSDSTFMLYSDGILEAMDASRHQYGEDRLLRSFQSVRPLPARSILEAVLDDTRQFTGGVEQHDDITLVVVKVR